MPELKAGTKLRSVSGGAEVIVTRGGEGTITCGGTPMVDSNSIDPATAQKPSDVDQPAVVLGKRYRTADNTVEVLCVKQGVGKLQLNGTPMNLLTQPKPLPASD